MLDFSPIVSVNKTRRKGIYRNATIVIDHVKELGDYIEIEIISEDNLVEDNLVKLKEIAKELDLNETNLVNTPYDELLYIKKEGKY